MSWSSTVRRVRDADRPTGQRVNALHSLIARHVAPLGFLGTRQAVRAQVGVTGRRWREEQVLRALEHLEASRAAHLAAVAEVATRRRVEKARGHRSPRADDVGVLEHPRWRPAPDIDLGAVLGRVVDEVFRTDPEREFRPPVRGTHQVRLTSPDGGRHAGLQVSDEVYEAWLFDDLDVSTMTFEYDEVEADKADACRRMAIVARAYLAGDFTVRQRRTLVRRRVQPLVDVQVDGAIWTLRRPAFSR